MDAKIAQMAAGAAPGAQQVGPVYRGFAEDDGGLTNWKVQLDAGQCYWFSGVGDGTVERLSLYLWDPNDSRLTSERSKSSTSIMAHCAEVTGMYRLQAKVTDGAGHYGVGIFAKAAPPKPPPPPPPAEPVKPDLTKLVAAEASAVAPGATLVGNFFKANADKSDWYTSFDPANCYWIVGVGGEGVKELYLYLWDPKDKRITENRSEGAKSNMGHCPTVGGMYHFQAKVNSGSGEYAVGVYAKKK